MALGVQHPGFANQVPTFVKSMLKGPEGSSKLPNLKPRRISEPSSRQQARVSCTYIQLAQKPRCVVRPANVPQIKLLWPLLGVLRLYLMKVEWLVTNKQSAQKGGDLSQEEIPLPLQVVCANTWPQSPARCPKPDTGSLDSDIGGPSARALGSRLEAHEALLP